MALTQEFWICPRCGCGFWGQPSGNTVCADCENAQATARAGQDSPFCPGCGNAVITRIDDPGNGAVCVCGQCGATWREVTSHAI